MSQVNAQCYLCLGELGYHSDACRATPFNTVPVGEYHTGITHGMSWRAGVAAAAAAMTAKINVDDVREALDRTVDQLIHDRAGLLQLISTILIELRSKSQPTAVLSRTDNDLTFHELILANLSRVQKWHALEDWSPLEWAGAMCGEAGEAANYAKKFKRIESEIANNDKRMFGLEVPKDQLLEKYREGIGLEVADVFIYGVLLCARVNVDLVACIRTAFNTKSIEYGFPERL